MIRLLLLGSTVISLVACMSTSVRAADQGRNPPSTKRGAAARELKQIPADPGAANLKFEPLPDGAIELHHCELEFEQSTMVGTNTGIYGAITVKEYLVQLGDKVKAGDIIGRLDDRELRGRYVVLEETANNDINVRVAESRLKESLNNLKRIENLRLRNKSFLSDAEYERTRLDSETVRLLADQAKHLFKVAKLECLEVKAQLSNREVRSPHDGTLVEILKKPGESVNINEPMFQVVNTEVLRVTGYANLEHLNKVAAGQMVEIYPEVDSFDPAPSKALIGSVGKVIFVDRRVDPKTRTFKIIARAEGANENLSSGMEARMVIFPKTAQANTDKTPPPAAAAPVASPVVSTEKKPSTESSPSPLVSQPAPGQSVDSPKPNP